MKSKQKPGEENIINFKTPFVNKCIAVIINDAGTSGIYVTGWKIFSTPTKQFFKAYYTNIKGEAVSPYLSYIAIGY